MSPSRYNAYETLHSLRFAHKCRSVAFGKNSRGKLTWKKATKEAKLISKLGNHWLKQNKLINSADSSNYENSSSNEYKI